MSRWRTNVSGMTRCAWATWALVGGLGAQALQAAQTQGGFVPATEIAKEALPATPLLYGAYAFVWLALIGYVFMLWRRLARVEHELREVSARLSGGKRS